MEGNVDHAEELDDLAKEGRLDIFYCLNRKFDGFNEIWSSNFFFSL